MPWPMVHFSIAYEMFEGNPCNEFLLGSIAPDAVQLRNDKISKAKSHLHHSRGECPDWSGLVDFYYTKVNDSKDDGFKMFLLGYVSHIIADDLWVKYKHELSGSDKRVLKTLWDEENKYDFHLKRTVPWRDVVEEQVTDSALYILSDLYNLDELDHWRRHAFIWLHTPGNELLIENQYLDDSNAGAFIEETASTISGWMKANVIYCGSE
ncbi:zinc dependent phospholipase C family protein [Paenibacillus alkalitolerans]|uniref:zinc dependent phospholipase C family protein n=1 Tax=Paenibacillus alkalitolerans TaxID=2799335 RepID=UPI0018F3BF28|nr:zinc dependent phospholipase C family protein [Paenibacillus alkalitolerans]